MSSDIIEIFARDKLKEKNIVMKYIYHIPSKSIVLSLNHKHIPPINAIFKINIDDWRKNAEQIIKIMKPRGVDLDTLEQLGMSLDDFWEPIYEAYCSSEEEKEEGGESEQPSKIKELVPYKYSQMGKKPLHEAIIIKGLPYFVKYDNEINKFDLLETIEETSRILRPPSIEEYPYTPYEFESKEELGFYLEKARYITLDQLYIFSKSKFLRYVDQDPYIINLLAADSIWTYFQDLFPATHYGEGVGSNDVGKSSIGYTFEYTGYRVVKATGISGANYSRVLGSIEPGQCVIIEDEGDNISEDPEKVKILKAGYEYNSKIPKINMNTRDQGQNWYFVFCYKMILAEKSLKEYKAKGLVDRTFSFPCKPGKVKYSIKEVVSQNINKTPKLQKLYEELLSFRKLMLCYRLVHYKDFVPDIETGLKNRDQELCKPLLQLFYGTKVLETEIIPTLETFVKQRRSRKEKSLEAALYPIIKKYVFANTGLNYETNTYSDLKEKKKTSVKVPFYEIWDYIKQGGIDGQYDEKKNKYAYETINYGSLYLNSLPTIISNKFAAEAKKQNYGSALVFDIDKLERFEDLYNDIYLKGNQVKIEVKVKKSDDYDDYDDFPEVHTDILEKKDNEQNDILGSIERDIEINENYKIAETEEIEEKNINKEVNTLSESRHSLQSRHFLPKLSPFPEKSSSLSEQQEKEKEKEEKKKGEY